MIVCDMCPDRTPATYRMTIEMIDPEKPKPVVSPAEDPFGLRGLAALFGRMPEADVRVAISLCRDHAKLSQTDSEIFTHLFNDAVRGNEPPPRDADSR